MRRTSSLLAATAALALMLQPSLALARAGGGHSMGSRGSFTYSPPPVTRTAPSYSAPMERSVTPRPGNPSHGAPAYGAPYRSGFGSGFLGGLLGVGLGSLLFGHAFGGGFGLIWLLIRIAIVVLIVRWLFRLFRGRSPAYAGIGNAFTQGPPGRASFPMGGGRAAPPAVAVGPDDYRAFEQSLQGIQDAWSRSDVGTLGQLATPEMVSYFAGQLSDHASRGVRNTVSDVQLLSGDLAQAWNEQGRDYATVAMRFSMLDVTRDANGRVVDGSPTEQVIATELWTFMRARGGRWILSAIQQAG